MTIQKCKDLMIYNLSLDLSMDIFEITKKFPKEEKYSLIDQIRRSSRSIPANIREGFAKRKYSDVFLRHLNDALGSAEETLTWLEISMKCSYIDKTTFNKLNKSYSELCSMIFKMMRNWKDFSK